MAPAVSGDDRIDALLMCGGRGTRLDSSVEKPLFEIEGVPMVDRVRRALSNSRVGTVHAVVSPNAPDTREHLDGKLPLIETPGEGYVTDLGVALSEVGDSALTVAADLPLLTSGLVDRILAAHAERDRAIAVAVPVELKRRLGASVDPESTLDGVAPAGINVVTDSEDIMYTSYDARLAVNVNRRSDARLAEALLIDGEATPPDAEELL